MLLWRPEENRLHWSVEMQRTTQEKLAIFKSCFSGLKNVYGTYDPNTNRCRQVKQLVTDEVILKHLLGRQSYGVYLLVGNKTQAVAVDFDEQDSCPPLQFIRHAEHYGLAAYIERSKSKGWHVWIFLELPGVLAAKARLVVKDILDDIGKPATEIFPKQDRLEGIASYGNYINAPLFGLLVPQGRTVFVNPDSGFKPYPNQWDLLAGVQRVKESLLDEIIEINQLNEPDSDKVETISTQCNSALGLTPCAQKMLTEGVSEYQRVSCFRLAVQLKKAGLPEDIAHAALVAWSTKNHPVNSKGIITDDEITQQVSCAFTGKYRGCGCEDPAITPYCDSSCPLKSQNSNIPHKTDIKGD
jgi:hypothetical protein